jgi:hypothetical protein
VKILENFEVKDLVDARWARGEFGTLRNLGVKVVSDSGRLLEAVGALMRVVVACYRYSVLDTR